MKDNPLKRKCGDCKYFVLKNGNNGYCKSIDDNVSSWWTGCIRNKANKNKWKNLAKKQLNA